MAYYSLWLEAPCAPTFLLDGDLRPLAADLPPPFLGGAAPSPARPALGQSLVSWSPTEAGQVRQRGAWVRQNAALWPGFWQQAHTVGLAWNGRIGRDSRARTATPTARTASAMAGGRSSRMAEEAIHPEGERRFNL